MMPWGPDDKGLTVPLGRPLSPLGRDIALGVLDLLGSGGTDQRDNLTAPQSCGLSVTWEPGAGALDSLLMTQGEGWHSGGRGECLWNWDKVGDRLSSLRKLRSPAPVGA